MNLTRLKDNKLVHYVKDRFEFGFVVLMFAIIAIVLTETEFTIDDLQVQTFLLRMLHSVAVLFVVVELFRSAGYIDNLRLSRIAWRLTTWVFCYFVARIIAGIFDSWFGFSIGWLSNNVQLAFWLIIYFKVRRGRVMLGSSKNTEQRVLLRHAIDSLLNQMEEAKTNTQRILENSKV